jgi:Flp pilus assembly protein TadG
MKTIKLLRIMRTTGERTVVKDWEEAICGMALANQSSFGAIVSRLENGETLAGIDGRFIYRQARAGETLEVKLGKRAVYAPLASRRGATTVEFACVCPILLLFVLALIEVGQAVFIKQQLEGAAITAARAACMESATLDSVKASIRGPNRNVLIGIRSFDIQVSPNPPSKAIHNQNVTVTLTAGFGANSWLPLPRWLANQTLSATSTMRSEAINVQ